MERRIDFTRVNDEINQVFYKEKDLDDILNRLSGKQNLFKKGLFIFAICFMINNYFFII
jgi:uncharacterized protein YpuA (DUF1002 family)